MNKVKSFFRTSNRIDVTPGIYLTLIDYSDANSLVKHLNHLPFRDQTCSIPFPYTLADANAFITQVLKFEKEHNVQRDWAIRNLDGEQIGGIGLLYSHGLNAHRSEMGYWLSQDYWNKGIMTLVVKTFASHIFNTTKIVRLEALVFEGNQSSVRVLEKAGFTKEGFLRQAYQKDKQSINAHLFSLLASEISPKN